MTETIWIIGTFTGIGTTVLSWLVTISFWLFMKQEGRFFFRRNFDKRGIDVIRHTPGSNNLELIRVKWNGQYFQYKDEMMFFGVESVINPESEAKQYYNEVVSRMCTWLDSKRPVLIATDIMSHLVSPDLMALVSKTRKHAKYEKARKLPAPGWLQLKDEDMEIQKVSYLETMKPEDLKDVMEDLSARDAWQVYQTGKRVNELENKKGMDLGGAAKIAISVAGIGLVLLIIYMAATGRLTEIIDTVAN